MIRLRFTVSAVQSMVVVLLLLVVRNPALTQDLLPYEGPGSGKAPVPTRWLSPDGLPKPAHHAPAYVSGPLLIETAPSVPSEAAAQGGQKGRVAIVVSDSVYDAVAQAVTEFTWDLQAFGYSTVVCRFVSGSPESLRAYLADLYNEPAQLKGAILIGDIPYVIYEVMQSWGGSYEYEDFPCDMYYMDLNGVWSDELANGSVQPNNGKYDTWTGETNLEIWVGRIKTDNLYNIGSEASLINSYLAKVHSFRSRASVTARTALVYDDDDWGSMTSGDVSALQQVFGPGYVSGVGDAEATTASDYKTVRLPQSTRWYLVRSHGYSGGHGFYRSGRTQFDFVYTNNYTAADPPGSFFSLYVCSGCDYTAANNLGATVAFNPDSAGLFAVGSAKTGGMWQDDAFYGPMAQGYCVGESFRLWFNQVRSYRDAPQWWYGMVMLGDPTLRPDYPTPADVKRQSNGTGASLFGQVVTHSFGDYFYVENPDRSSGIRVHYPGNVLKAGVLVDISGSVQTDSNDERYIEAANAVGSGTGSADPVGMICRAVGGCDCGYSPDSGAGQRGVTGGYGLNNIGLLVRICGRLICPDSTTFAIDDGSGRTVECPLPPGVTVDPTWKYATVTGISSCRKSGTDLSPVVLVRQSSDISHLP